MLFLSPIFLWFVAAAAVPVIIHLINRRRHKTIQWAAMQFLLKATRESRGKKKLRHILILTCRALALAALAFAAARPVASGLLGWGGGGIDTVVLVLDRSASMEMATGNGRPSRRAAALAQVGEALKAVGSARLVLIDSASGAPQEVASVDVLGELSAAAATDSTADLPGLYNRAVEFVSDLEGRTEIWLVSDMQTSNWMVEDDRWSAARASLAALPKPAGVRVLSLTAAAEGNHSLRVLGTRREGDDLLLDVEITRAEETAGSTSIPLTTHLNGVSTTASLVVPGQALRFQKRVEVKDTDRDGFGWLSLPADANPRDNVGFFAYGPVRQVESLVVAEAGESADFLELAVSPPGLAGYSSRRIEPDAVARELRDDLAAVFWAAPLPTGEAAQAVKGYLSRGGQVVFFPPTANQKTDFEGLSWSAMEEADQGRFFILKDWNRQDGPLRDGVDGTPVAGGKLKGIRRCIPDDETTPLATWEDGRAFLSRHVMDRGTAWFVGSLPDYTWSNLADADVLLPLSLRVLAAGSERLDAMRMLHVGENAARPLPGETRTRLDSYGTADPANATYEAGVHQLGQRMVAVNRPLAEDDLAVASREQLDLMLAGSGYTLFDQAGEADASSSRDVWQSFLVAMLLFLLAEAWLCLPKRPGDTAGLSPSVAPRAT